MEHFYRRIPGWFSFAALYQQIVKEAQDGAHFVEVGSWQGRSASFMAVEIANSRKRIAFDCVDTWLGSADMQTKPEVTSGKLFEIFSRNITPVRKYIRVVRMQSVQAALRYGDGTLDFVFIDADHRYECVNADILAWWPKVKPGGLLAGDDFLGKGVSRAVIEVFTGRYDVMKGSGSGMQWLVRKPTIDSALEASVGP